MFNHCIYGNINTNIGSITLTYHNNKLTHNVSSIYELDENTYQFNLGDSDILGNEAIISENDICIIEYFNENQLKLFSDIIHINLSNSIQQFDIVINGDFIENNESASLAISENVIKVSNYKISERNQSLYNYFAIVDVNNNTMEYNSNKDMFYFLPTESKRYKITEKSINKTTNIISENEFIFNAVVSDSYISRAVKCKEINESIKILFKGYDSSIHAYITTIKDNAILESSELSNNLGLYSYNFIFPSNGHYCFIINYGDETFLTNFRVNMNNLRVYYSNENHTSGLTLSYELYNLNDSFTLLNEGLFNNIGNGIYASDIFDIKYGDYKFIIDGDEYIVPFGECHDSILDTTLRNTQNNEDIYWIFPNNIGD